MGQAIAVLLVKLLLAPALVGAATLVARRWGPRVGGLVSGLPVLIGPILLVLVLQHDADFGQEAAVGSLLGFVPLVVFTVAYARLAGRGLAPVPTVLAGWAAFLVAMLALSAVHLPRGAGVLVACAGILAGLRLLRGPAVATPAAVRRPPAWDLPARMVAAAAMVLVISGLSGALGAHVSGLLTPFPVITSILAVFLHNEAGAEPTRALLRGFLLAFFASAVFCFVLSEVLGGAVGTAAAFGIATVGALAMQGVVVAVTGAHARGPRRRAAGEYADA